jgi:hypothetical protein
VRFLRGGPAEPVPPVDFWAWWAGARERIAQAIAGSAFDAPLIDEVGRAVQTIHPAMAWELAPGGTAQHAFCISPEGNPELRQLALRWLQSAPPVDALWEYHPSKQARPQLGQLEVAGVRLDVAETRTLVSWDATRQRADVRLWHPAFAEAPQRVRQQVAFIFLDNLLGEDDVERWVGEIALLEGPVAGRTPDELRAEIDRRRTEATDGDTWVLRERTGPDGSTAIVVADAALKRIDHPFADRHVTIATVFGADRMPTPDETSLLNGQEDDLLRRLGSVAVYAGRVTQPGSRTMHFVAQDPDAMRPAIDGWAQDLPDHLSDGLPQLRIKVNFARDMAWSFQRELGVR